MGFSEEQVRALKRTVPARSIRTRNADGKELSYIEGWYAIAEANRIFGFASWDRETVEARCVMGREARGTFTAVYLAKVRVTVHTSDTAVIREGHGTGEAHGDSAGEAHDRALKAAETDATKRALTTFGRAFGLALYSPKPARKKAPQRVGATGSVDQPRLNGPTMATLIAALAPSPAEDGAGAAAAAASTSAADNERSSRDGPRRSQLFLPRRINGRRIDKSVLTFAEIQRVRDKEHLRLVGSQPCLLCSATPADAHHIRYAQPKGLGQKVSDEFTVPLCRRHHHDLHRSGNEAAWWHDLGIDPLEIAKELWAETQQLAEPKDAAGTANGVSPSANPLPDH